MSINPAPGSGAIALVSRVDALLEHLDAATLNGDDLRELVVQCERATAMLQATQASAMVAMVEETRAEGTPLDRGLYGDGHPEKFVVDEIAALLSCTKNAASVKLGAAWNASQHRALGQAWRSGSIDQAKVRTIAEGIAPLTGEDTQLPQLVDESTITSVVDAAVAYAADHTTGQLRPWIARRVVTIDPNAAERRRQRAMADRRVVITPNVDGMSELWAYLPSVEARQIQQALTTMAHDADADDPRRVDERRADALCDLLLGRATAPDVSLHVVLTAGADEQTAAELAGVGPITVEQVGELLSIPLPGSRSVRHDRVIRPRVSECDATSGYLMVSDAVAPRATRERRSDPSGYRPSAALARAIRERDLTCRFPHCRRSAVGSASGVDIDHTVPWPRGQTVASNLACLCRRHHRLKHQTRWQVEHVGAGVLTWTGPTGRTYTTSPWAYRDPPTQVA